MFTRQRSFYWLSADTSARLGTAGSAPVDLTLLVDGSAVGSVLRAPWPVLALTGSCDGEVFLSRQNWWRMYAAVCAGAAVLACSWKPAVHTLSYSEHKSFWRLIFVEEGWTHLNRIHQRPQTLVHFSSSIPLSSSLFLPFLVFLLIQLCHTFLFPSKDLLTDWGMSFCKEKSLFLLYICYIQPR